MHSVNMIKSGTGVEPPLLKWPGPGPGFSLSGWSRGSIGQMRRVDALHVRLLSPEKDTLKTRCHKRIMSFILAVSIRDLEGGLEASSSNA
jgi:hypothetical protein